MKKHYGLSVVVILTGMFLVSGAAWAQTAGPSDAGAKKAFQQIMAAADTNKDGKLTVEECMAMFKNKKMGETNCKFWDANKDGVITEAEYVAQARKQMKK
jgi:hypothetical protein